MALERRSSAGTIYLQAKHYFLWQELKKEQKGCDIVEVTNPKTGAKLTKYGIGYHTVRGRVTKIVKYDTGNKYSTRYFGFKLILIAGPDVYSFEMPYNSQALRRFLVVAPNIDWSIPLAISIFKGKKKENSTGADPTVIWFRQGDGDGQTIKAFFTKDAPNGMPEATQDPHSKEWDFRTQRRWLVDNLILNIMPAIEAAAQNVAPPLEPVSGGLDHDPGPLENETEPQHWEGITDDDVPF